MKKRILIIDDEPHILLMLKKMLERSGYEIDMAANGMEGIRLFRESQADLVITSTRSGPTSGATRS